MSADDTKTVFAQVKYRAVTKGSYFVTDHDKAYIRFTRFMSLVPNNVNCTTDVDCTDYADNSSLKGIMRDCKIDGQAWDSSKIAFAWSVQKVGYSYRAQRKWMAIFANSARVVSF